MGACISKDSSKDTTTNSWNSKSKSQKQLDKKAKEEAIADLNKSQEDVLILTVSPSLSPNTRLSCK